jgi:hypothetical protein
MSRSERIAAQTAAVEQLLLLQQQQQQQRTVPEESDAAADLADLRGLLRQTSIRLVLLQKAHEKTLRENVDLTGRLAELQRVIACTHKDGVTEDAHALSSLVVPATGSSSHRRQALPGLGLLLVVSVALLVAVAAVALVRREKPPLSTPPPLIVAASVDHGAIGWLLVHLWAALTWGNAALVPAAGDTP